MTAATSPARAGFARLAGILGSRLATKRRTSFLAVGVAIGVMLCAAFGAWQAVAAESSPASSPSPATPAASPAAMREFREQVVPLLRERCFGCHAGRDAEAGYRLDLRAELLGETSGVPLVVPGDSGASRLIAAVRHDARKRMPPDGPPLDDRQVALLRRWIDGGLAWDRQTAPETDEDDGHWAFRPVVRPGLPTSPRNAGENVRANTETNDVPNAGPDVAWSRTAVDRFVSERRRAHGITAAAPAAPPRTLVRRLYLDLWGLPPSWEEIEAFAADDRPDAAERLIDRLLASPRYGERWGRHWLDVARWAESEGFESNHPRPFAWRYRDYVVRAFSRDKPFDEFVREQIAGDLLSVAAPEADEQAAACEADERLIATGFLAAARISSNEEDKWLQRNDVTVDVVNAVGGAFLGLTLHCAQCHNHKFDPITIRDYYRLHAFFASGMPVNVRLGDEEAAPNVAEATRPWAEFEQALAVRQAIFERARQRMFAQERARMTADELAVIDTPAEARTVDQERLARKAEQRFVKGIGEMERLIDDGDRRTYDAAKKRLAELTSSGRIPPQTFAFYSPASRAPARDVLPSIGFYPLEFEPRRLLLPQTYVMIRGDVHQIGPKVTPGWPAVFKPSTAESGASASLDRRHLADWLTDRQNPLVSRVWANRVWQLHFGGGLVATPDDFGVRGARPSHPELLDWLAAELLDHGWSTKRLHRAIVASATFRQSLRPAEGDADDLDNVWLARWAPRRLDVETLHDSLLAASDELDRRLGGPSVPTDQRERSRRANLYLFQRRGQPTEMQRLFDGPNECAASIATRHVSTSPLQSLYLLNSPFVVERARSLADAVERTIERQNAGESSTVSDVESTPDASTPDEPTRRIDAAFRRIVGRSPSADDRTAARRLWNAAIESAAAPNRPSSNAPADAAAPQVATPASPLELLCQALLNLNEFAYME